MITGCTRFSRTLPVGAAAPASASGSPPDRAGPEIAGWLPVERAAPRRSAPGSQPVTNQARTRTVSRGLSTARRGTRDWR